MPKFQHFGVLINIQANTWSLHMISTFNMWFLLKILPFILQIIPFLSLFVSLDIFLFYFANCLFVLIYFLSFLFLLINWSQRKIITTKLIIHRIQPYTEYSPIQNAALYRIQFYTEYSPIQRRTSSYCCKTFGKTFPFATISFITISHESLSTNLCPQGLKVIFKPPVNKIFPAPIINRQLLFIIYCLVLQLQIINN